MNPSATVVNVDNPSDSMHATAFIRFRYSNYTFSVSIVVLSYISKSKFKIISLLLKKYYRNSASASSHQNYILINSMFIKSFMKILCTCRVSKNYFTHIAKIKLPYIFIYIHNANY